MGNRLKVRVFYHDKCFDGACSASLFTRFHRECIAKSAVYEYHGLVHRAGALFDESEFTGDENANPSEKKDRDGGRTVSAQGADQALRAENSALGTWPSLEKNHDSALRRAGAV